MSFAPNPNNRNPISHNPNNRNPINRNLKNNNPNNHSSQSSSQYNNQQNSQNSQSNPNNRNRHSQSSGQYYPNNQSSPNNQSNPNNSSNSNNRNRQRQRQPRPPSASAAPPNPSSGSKRPRENAPEVRSEKDENGEYKNLSYNANQTSKKVRTNDWQQATPAPQQSIFGVLDPVADANKIASRGKQISYGKNTLGYDNYTEKVPKEHRKMAHPWTPDHKANIPNKRWLGLLKTWRAELHKFDPEGLKPTTKSCPEAEDLIGMLGNFGGDEEKKKAQEAGLVVKKEAASQPKQLSWGERCHDSDDDLADRDDDDDVYAQLAKGVGGLDDEDEDSDDDLL